MSLADYVRSKPTLETARLLIRPLVPADIPALKEWMPDESIYAYWGKGPGKAERNPELLFARESRPAKSFHLGIALRETGQVVGDVWVYRIVRDREATVAVRLGRPHQGRGYGTEALDAMVRFCFGRTELKRLRAEVDVRNVASQRMLEKCGFAREGGVRRGKMVSVRCEFYAYGLEKGG